MAICGGNLAIFGLFNAYLMVSIHRPELLFCISEVSTCETQETAPFGVSVLLSLHKSTYATVWYIVLVCRRRGGGVPRGMLNRMVGPVRQTVTYHDCPAYNDHQE